MCVFVEDWWTVFSFLQFHLERLDGSCQSAKFWRTICDPKIKHVLLRKGNGSWWSEFLLYSDVHPLWTSVYNLTHKIISHCENVPKLSGWYLIGLDLERICFAIWHTWNVCGFRTQDVLFVCALLVWASGTPDHRHGMSGVEHDRQHVKNVQNVGVRQNHDSWGHEFPNPVPYPMTDPWCCYIC